MEAPTVTLCECPNGCVVLRFGYVTAHLPRGAFLAFARKVVRMAHALDRSSGHFAEH